MSFSSASPEQIGEFWRNALGWQVVFDRTDRRTGGCVLEAATFGGLCTARQRVDIGCTGFTDTADSYVAWVSTRGRSVYQHGRDQYASSPDRMLAYSPGVLRRVAKTDAGTESTYVKLESWVLERHLEKLLERPVGGPIALAPMTDLRLGMGSRCWSLVRILNAMLLDPDSPAHPAVVNPLCEAMMTSLLLSVDHPYRDVLDRPVAPCRPRHVRRAVETIHAHPEHPYTVSALADLAGVSVRTLQEGFRAHLNTAPMAYLRHVRLTRAHDELSRDGTVSVADVAFRWGFTHLGRFAARYAKHYGTLPSQVGHRGTTPQAGK